MVMNAKVHFPTRGSKRPLSIAISQDPLLLQWIFALSRLTAEERNGMLSRGAHSLAERLERPDLGDELGLLASEPVFDAVLDEVSEALLN